MSFKPAGIFREKVSFLFKNWFLFTYLRQRECTYKQGKGRGRGREASNKLPTEYKAWDWLHPRTSRSGPEMKSRVGRETNWATQGAPGSVSDACNFFWNDTAESKKCINIQREWWSKCGKILRIGESKWRLIISSHYFCNIFMHKKLFKNKN